MMDDVKPANTMAELRDHYSRKPPKVGADIYICELDCSDEARAAYIDRVALSQRALRSLGYGVGQVIVRVDEMPGKVFAKQTYISFAVESAP